MASPLNKWSIYDCFYVRIELNDIVKERASLLGIKLSEEKIDEKNVPTNPTLWSKAKSLAKSKFDVYPSAYANGWAAKNYKSKGGTWRKCKN